MTITPDSLKRDLADGAAADARADRSAAEIRTASEERLKQVDARLAELRPLVVTDDQAADEYQALTRERGELAIVLAHD